MIPEPLLSTMKILIVDDEPANLALLQYILLGAGFRDLRTTSDPREVRDIHDAFEPDLILLDLMMPHLSGFEVMRQLDERIDPDECLPILVLTADVSLETKNQALEAGASDFLTKPFDHVEVMLRIRHLLHIRAQHRQLAHHNETLEETVAARTGELRNTLGRLEETVAQLRSTQQQVIQHERLSALGSMAAGLAHDFNNSLSLILGYSELLQGDLAGTPFQAHSDEFLGTIITATQDAATMFDRLRTFYRPPDEEDLRRAVQVNDVVEQAIGLTRPRWHAQALADGATIRLARELALDLPELYADPGEMREMLTNLIFNAVDAMPEGGAITVVTRLDRAGVAGVAGVAEDENALILEVADTGTGMDEETRRRCLEPFFTTKGVRGTGLGLSMVYGTVQRLGGTVNLHSAPGLGTRFVLRLPLRRPVAREEAISVPIEEQPMRRILVVDDQSIFVEILRHYLAGDGHRVETAGNGREGLEKFRAAAVDDPFELVITDKAMPGMSGEHLAANIKDFDPQTRVILLTGFGILDESMERRLPNVDLAILKPITHAALRGAIARVMAGIPPRSGHDHKRRKRPRFAALPDLADPHPRLSDQAA